MFMAPWSNECAADLARKCSVPGTFFTSTKPDSAQPLVRAMRVTPLRGAPGALTFRLSPTEQPPPAVLLAHQLSCFVSPSRLVHAAGQRAAPDSNNGMSGV